MEQKQKVKWGQGHFFSQRGVQFLESTVGNFFAEDDLFGTIPATLEMPLWSSVRQVTKANLGRQEKERNKRVFHF